jgi:hypothetical protein
MDLMLKCWKIVAQKAVVPVSQGNPVSSADEH